MHTLLEELHQAGIRLLRNKLLTTTKIGLLALGLGCCFSVFTIYNSVLLRPQDYPNSQKILCFGQTDETRANTYFSAVNVYAYEAISERLKGVSKLGFVRFVGNTPLEMGDIRGEYFGVSVSADLFEVFGIDAHKGAIISSRNTNDGSVRQAMISYDMWENVLQKDPDIVGRSAIINKMSCNICGVLPPDFALLGNSPEESPYIYFLTSPDDFSPDRKKPRICYTFALNEAGTSRTVIENQLSAIEADLKEQHPDLMAKKGLAVQTFREYSVSNVIHYLKITVWVGALILLLTLANLSQLCLAQSISRQQDYAIRMALGAEPFHLYQSVLVEFFILSALGGLLGIGIAQFLKNISLSRIPYFQFEVVAFDWRIFLFFLAIVSLVSLVSAVFPVWHTRTLSIESSLRSGSCRMQGSPMGKLFGKALIGFEVMLCSALLIHCGLLLYSTHRRNEVDRNIDMENLTYAWAAIPTSLYPEPENRYQLLNKMLEALENDPDIISVAAGNGSHAFPQIGAAGTYPFIDDDEPKDFSLSDKIILRYVASEHYFETLGLQLLKGRKFSPHDTLDAPRVAIVSKNLVDRFWPGEEALGKRILVNHRTDDWSTVIGVVEDRISADWQPQPVPIVYRPPSYFLYPSITFMIKLREHHSFDAERFIALIKSADPFVYSEYYGNFKKVLKERGATVDVMTQIILVFSVVALLQTFFGIFAVIYYSTSQRMGEFSLKIALGARDYTIRNSLLTETLKISLLGLILGWALAKATYRFTASMLYEVHPWQPYNLLFITMVIMLAAAAGSLVPALRASRSDPLEYLRQS
jgi:predicted permease